MSDRPWAAQFVGGPLHGQRLQMRQVPATYTQELSDGPHEYVLAYADGWLCVYHYRRYAEFVRAQGGTYRAWMVKPGTRRQEGASHE